MYTENVKFYLKDAKADTETAITATAQVKGRRFKYGIGYSIIPDLWDADRQRPKQDKNSIALWKKEIPQIRTILQNINTRQENIAAWIVDYVSIRDQAGHPYTHEDLRCYLDEKLGIARNSDKSDDRVLSYYRLFIDGMKSGNILKANKGVYSSGTIRTYEVTCNKLAEYEKTLRGSLRFDDVTMNFYDAFLQFFYDQDLTHNSFGNNIKHLKVIMEHARNQGLHDNLTYRDKRFKVLDEPVFTIYLTTDEIERIKSLDFSDKPKYEKTRDIFLVCYHTAARISDAMRINASSFYEEDGNTFVEILVKKSNYEHRVDVPAKRELLELLTKYEFRVPYYSEQKVNENLKQIGKWAGIDEMVKKTEKRGGKTIVKELRKYEMITTHSARRSAATNMYKEGIHPYKIMKITGHKTEKSFLKYIRIDAKENAKMLADHNFFK